MKTIYLFGLTLMLVLFTGREALAQCDYSMGCESCVSMGTNSCSEDVDFIIDLDPAYTATPDEVFYTLNGTSVMLTSSDFTFNSGSHEIEFTVFGLSGLDNTVSVDSIIESGVDTCRQSSVTLDIDIVVPVGQTISLVNQTTCEDSLVTATSTGDASFTYDWTLPDGSTDSGNPVDQIVTSSDHNASFIVTVTDDNGCTVEAVSDPLVVNAPPNVPNISINGNTGTGDNICEGDAISLEVTNLGSATVTWTNSSGADQGTDNPLIITSTSNDTYTATLEFNSEGCFTSASQEVDFNTLPVITINNGDAYPDMCFDAPVLSLTATPAGGDWTGDGVIGGSSNNPRFRPSDAMAGIHTLTYTFQHPMTGCENSSSVDIEVFDNPTIGNITHTCNTDGTGEIDITASDGGGGSLEFSIGGPFQSSNTFSSVSTAPTGTITLTVTVREMISGSITCEVTEDYTFTCTSECPIVDAGNNDEICFEDSYQLDGSVSNTGTGFMWSGGLGSFDDATLLDAIYTPVLADGNSVDLTLSIPDPDGAGGCMANSSTMTLSINPLPGIAGIANQSKCAETNLQIEIDVTSGTGSYIYEWSSSPTGSFVDNTIEDPVFIQNMAGSSLLSVLVTDSKDCSEVGNIMVVTNSLPATPIPSNNSVAICEGDANEELSVTVAGGSVTADWFDENNMPVASNTFNYTPTVTGVGTYTYTISSRNTTTMCVGENLATITYVIRARPSISNTTTTNTICSGEMSSGFVFTSSLPGTTFSWTSSSSGVSGHTSSGSGNIPTETLMTTGSTQGTVDYVVVPSLNACPGISETFTITVNPLPNTTLSTPSEVCSNDAPLQLTGNPTSGMFSGDGVNSMGLFTPSQVSGTASIMYTFVDANGCADSDSKTIEVNTAPSVSISNFDNEVCLDEAPFSIPGSPSGGLYTSSNSGVSSSGLFTPSNAGEGTANFTYTFTDSNGCSNLENGSILVNSLPDADIDITDNSGIPGDETICRGDNISLAAQPSGITYLWEGGQITNNTSGTVSVSPSEQTSYRVTVTDANGCTDTSNESIKVNENPRSEFEIATTFNPIFFDQPFSLNNNSVISPDASLNSYTWCFDPSNVINLKGQSLTDISLIDIEANNNNGTSSEAIDITLKIVDDNQCVDEIAASVNIVAMDCFAQTDFDPTEVHCKGEEIDINFMITVSTGAILTDIGARMTLGTTNINLSSIPNTTNFRIDDPLIIDRPGEWKFQLMFSDNNSQLCNDVIQEYTVRIEENPNAAFDDLSMINTCKGAGPILLPLQINFPELIFSDNVEISYDIVQDGMLIRQLSKDFNPQTSILSIDDADLVDVNPGLFEVVLTSIDNTDLDCPSQSLDSRKPIQIYDLIEFEVSDIQCEPDSTFSFNVTISGGTGTYSIEDRIGVISATLVDPGTNTYKYLCRLENYQIIIKDDISGCLPVEINKESLPPPGCDCSFVYKDVVAGEISVTNGVLIDNVHRICSDENFEITINDAQFTLATDSIVIYVLSESSIEDSILSRSIVDVSTNIINGNTFSASLGNLTNGVEYTIYAGVVQKSRDNESGLQAKNLTCTSFSSATRILFYQDPDPLPIVDDTEFCSNESNIVLDATNLISTTETGFESSSIFWEVLDGNQNVANTVSLGNSPSKVSAHLGNTSINSTYNLVLTEEVNYRGLTCTTTSITPITTGPDIAPDTASIIYWPGNILACTADTNQVSFRWGYIDHANGDEDVNNIGSGKFLFLDQSLDLLNSTDRTYYVNLRDLNDSDNRCNTIIFFTPTEGLDRDLTTGKNSIKVFPNPSNGNLIYQISGINDGDYYFNVFDIQGRVVQSLKKYKEEFIKEIPISLNVPPGLYMLQSIGPDGQSDVRKIMIHN